MRVKLSAKVGGNAVGNPDQIDAPPVAPDRLNGHQDEVKPARPKALLEVSFRDCVHARLDEKRERHVDRVDETKIRETLGVNKAVSF